jgi:hypothetical protein
MEREKRRLENRLKSFSEISKIFEELSKFNEIILKF